MPTTHLASPEVMSLEHVIDPEEVNSRDIAWINDCDVLIAEVSTPSHGVGYEICCALTIGKPVLCCYRKGVKVSKMITGNTMSGMELKSYTTPDEAVGVVSEYLQALAEQGGQLLSEIIGSTTVNVVPSPKTESTQMRPR